MDADGDSVMHTQQDCKSGQSLHQKRDLVRIDNYTTPIEESNESQKQRQLEINLKHQEHSEKTNKMMPLPVSKK